MASNGHDLAPLLLTAGDPLAPRITSPVGSSRSLIIGDHAGDVIPSSLGNLALAEVKWIRQVA